MLYTAGHLDLYSKEEVLTCVSTCILVFILNMNRTDSLNSLSQALTIRTSWRLY